MGEQKWSFVPKQGGIDALYRDDINVGEVDWGVGQEVVAALRLAEHVSGGCDDCGYGGVITCPEFDRLFRDYSYRTSRATSAEPEEA